MKMTRWTAVAALAVAGALSVPAIAVASGSRGGLEATGLAASGTALVRFDTQRPDKAWKSGTISGLVGDTKLVGIDRRVQNTRLYGVGNAGGIYTLASGSAKAVKVGQLSVALAGTVFGVDFNPAANALRIVSNTGQNLRQPFGTGDAPTGATVVDGALNYLAVPATGVTAAAYTNNDLDATTATSLFDLDTTLDQVVLQSPANSGSLAATGKFGFDAGPAAGFDIYTELRKGKATGNQAFATATANGSTRLYAVNLLTGELTDRGRLGQSVTDIAIDLGR